MTTKKLFLHEEILLLALRDDKGTIDMGVAYSQAVGGAVLAELLLAKRIKIEQEKKKSFLHLVSAKPLGDPLIDQCLEKVHAAKRRAVLQTWVARFAAVKNLKHLIAHELCRKRILKEDEDRVLLLFTRKIYPEVNPAPEKELIGRLNKAIFTYTKEIDPRTVVLLSLAKSTGLLPMVFDKKKLKERKDRIEKIINGEVIGKATQQATEAVQAAVAMACIMPAVFVATTTS